MTYDISKINATVAQAAAESANLSEASKGGDGYVPPATGPCIGTLISYIDLGMRLKPGFQGAPAKKVRRAELRFELAGPNHKPRESDDGTKTPQTLAVKVWLPPAGKQPSSKSGFYKLFSKLNHAKDPNIKIPAQCLGMHYRLNIEHEKFTPSGQSEEITFASIGGAQDGYRIMPALVDVSDELGNITGQRAIPKPELFGTIRCFLWEYADKGMWDSLFIDGEYEEKKDDKGNVTHPAKSKNVIQETIKEALDWVGSPMQQILAAGGELDTEEVAETKAPAVSVEDDPLAGML